jgi:hypothetical protein
MNTTMQGIQRHDRSALEAELKAAGAEIRGNAVKCPFHDDRHASGSIYQGDDGAWRFKCCAASCGVGGDLFDLRARVSGRSLEDVLREANPDARPHAQRSAERVFKDLADLRLAAATAGRIEAEYQYTDPDTGKIDLLVFRLKTPEGKAFRQCHSVPGGWVQRAPAKPWPLYRRAEIRTADEILIVEGEKVSDALNGIGVIATTSPAGAGKAVHADWTPVAGKRVWLWPDQDSPGRSHMKDVAAILDRLDPSPTVRYIEPDNLDLGDKEDAFDFIEQCRVAGMDPRQAVLDVMERAKSLSLSSGLRDRIEDTISGKWADVPWPWGNLTRLSRALLPQTVTILCGTPGAAKSFMVFESLLAWFDAGIPIACLALEEDRTYHLQRVLAIRERNVELLDPEWQKANADDARAAYARHQSYLDRFGKRIWDAPLEPMSLDAISAWVRDRAREGCRVIVVDPITAALASDNPWVADSKFVNDMKAITRSHDASLLLVTHPKKGSKLVGLDDLAGGASYQRLSQCILWLERHKTPKHVTVLSDCGRFQTEISQTLHLSKCRNGRGHGMALGFKIDWPTLAFAEQGIVVKESKGE